MLAASLTPVSDQTIDTRPKVVDIRHLVGDTLSIKITVPAGWVDGRDWSGQVRDSIEATVPGAQFTVTPDGVTPDVYYAVLASEDTRTLAAGWTPPPVRTGRTRNVAYEGVYDIQVSNAGSDPVNTVVRGELVLEWDVTRA